MDNTSTLIYWKRPAEKPTRTEADITSDFHIGESLTHIMQSLLPNHFKNVYSIAHHLSR